MKQKDFLLKHFSGKIILISEGEAQSNLWVEIVESSKYKQARNKKKKQKKDTLENLNELYEGRAMVINAFKSGIFLLPPTEETKFTSEFPVECVASSSCSIKYTSRSIKKPACSDKFELPDRSYSVPNISDCFKYSIKNHKNSYC